MNAFRVYLAGSGLVGLYTGFDQGCSHAYHYQGREVLTTKISQIGLIVGHSMWGLVRGPFMPVNLLISPPVAQPKRIYDDYDDGLEDFTPEFLAECDESNEHGDLCYHDWQARERSRGRKRQCQYCS